MKKKFFIFLKNVLQAADDDDDDDDVDGQEIQKFIYILEPIGRFLYCCCCYC